MYYTLCILIYYDISHIYIYISYSFYIYVYIYMLWAIQPNLVLPKPLLFKPRRPSSAAPQAKTPQLSTIT